MASRSGKQRFGLRTVAVAVVGSLVLATSALLVDGGDLLGPSERVRHEVAALRLAVDVAMPTAGGASSSAQPSRDALASSAAASGDSVAEGDRSVAASQDQDDVVVVSQLIRDVGATPAAVLGLSLFLLGTVMAPTGIGGAIAPVYGAVAPPVLTLYGTAQSNVVTATQSAGDAIAGAGPLLNPIVEPAATAVAQALEDQAPGLGTTLTFRDHFGLDVEDSSSSSEQSDTASPDTPPGVASLNYSVTARGATAFGGADVPAAEASVRASNGYLNTASGLNTGLAGQVLYTPLFLYGGNLAPRPYAAQAVYPSGPLQSSKPFLRPGQSDATSFGDAEATVAETEGNAHMRAARVAVEGLVSVGSIENTVDFVNEGSLVSTVSTALLNDVEIAGGLIKIRQLSTELRVTGTGAIEDRKVEATPTIVGLEVAGVPIVLLADGWTVGGSDALPAAEKKALEMQVAALLDQAGLRISTGTVDAKDTVDDNGVMTTAVASAIRLTQLADGEVAQDIGLAYTSAEVFTAPKPAVDFSFDDASVPPLPTEDASVPPLPADNASVAAGAGAVGAMPRTPSDAADIASGAGKSLGPATTGPQPALAGSELDTVGVAAELGSLAGLLALLAVVGLAAPVAAVGYLASGRVRAWRPDWVSLGQPGA